MAPSGGIDRIRHCWRGEEAQTMAEYGVVLAVITIVTVISFMALGDDIGTAIVKVRALL